MEHNTAKPAILVVDDEQNNLILLNRILTKAGYLVYPAISSELALIAAKKSAPDLILLDVKMPGLDGVEVCHRLKADPATQNIPVIFISANNDIDKKLQAFDAGGVDYLAKPFSHEEVLARVKLHLNLQTMQRQQKANNQKLQQEIERRERAELELAQSLAAEREHRLIAETLTDATLALVSQLSQQDLLEEILQQMLRLIPGVCGHIMLLKQDVLEMACWDGYEKYGSVVWYDKLTQPLAEFPLDAQVVVNKTPIIVHDTRNDPTWVRQPEASWILAHIAVPLYVGDRVQGLLRMDADRPNAFSLTDIKRLEPLARAAAVALENAKLYEHAQQEIIERTKTQETLRRYEFIVNASKELMTLIDRDHIFAAASQAYCFAHNKTQAEIVGSSVEAIWGKQKYSTRIQPHLQRCFFGLESNYESWIEFPRLGRRCMDVTYSPYRNQDGLVTHVVVVSRDVTDYRNTELALKQSYREQEQILTAIPSILIGIDRNGQITHWNQPAAKNFGWPPKLAIGRQLQDCDISWDWKLVGHAINTCLQNNQPVNLPDVRYHQPGRQEGILTIMVAPFSIGDEHDLGVLLLAQDITQYKILESQLSQAQKLEAVGRLAAGIAHEINTPTQFIGDNVGFIETSMKKLAVVCEQWQQFWLACQNTDAATLPEFIQMEQTVAQNRIPYLLQELPLAAAEAREGVERVTQIVKAMKDFSHPGVEQRVPLDINRAIISTVTVSRNEWKYVADVETSFDPALPPVSCFPGELNQAFLNILINAAHAIIQQTENGATGKGKITIATSQQQNYVEIKISDNGYGIPAHIQDRIFDPFFTTKEVGKGTGQGLAIAHAVIVEKHHGKISVESKVGQGTTFIINLPIDTLPALATPVL